MTVTGKNTSNHYHWGQSCDGWVLTQTAHLSVIEERMPPNSAEQRHFHSAARQFFYVLSGQLTMELEGEIHQIPASGGLEIEPGARHQARNDTQDDVCFLVISSPSTRGDRTDLDHEA